MKIKPIITLLFLISTVICFSQKEANNWLFGSKVGLQFGDLSSDPLVLRGELDTLEGCASISDSDGNLLFYSDGSTVWSRNDDVMPGGTDLLGDESSTQSAIIIPKPLDPNIYYLFTVGSTIVPTGYNYYTIDMSLNGGFGEVVGGNVNLTDGHGGSDWSEKITAVQGGECNTYWVISLVKDLYYSYKVDEFGVDPVPVVSQVDFVSEKSRGYLKVSPNGEKIVAAHQGNDSATNACFLYTFNHITGEVENDAITLFSGGNVEQPYGVEFSSQASKLYVSTIDNNNAIYRLYQFDLMSANVPNSKILIHSEEPAFRGALQLGPDLKIYVTIPEEYTVGTNYLDVIHDPELDGAACNFEQDFIYFGSDSYAMQGLPPFIQSFFFVREINIVNPFEPVTLTSQNLSICLGESYTLQGPDIAGADYQWSFSFGGLLVDLPTPTPPHQLVINNTGANNQGTYNLIVSTYDVDCDIQFVGEANVTFTTPPVINSSATLSSCDFFDSNSNDGLTTFNLYNSIPDIAGTLLNPEVYFYLSIADAENDIYNQNALPQFYSNTSQNQVIITKVYENGSDCYNLGELQLSVSPSSVLNAPNLYECDSGDGNASFDLNAALNNIITINSLPNTADVLFFNSLENAVDGLNPISGFYETLSETIYFYVFNNGSCYGSGVFNLVVNPVPAINPEDSNLALCQFNFPLTINSTIAYNEQQNYFYNWSNGAVTNEIVLQDEQVITVTVSDRITGCATSKTFNITQTSPPIITDVDVNINSGTVTIISPNNPNLTYHLDNPNGIPQTDNIFYNVAPGVHTVYVSNECGITEKEIFVLGFPKFFTPNGDNAHDTWKVKGIDINRFAISDIYIMDRYGKLLKTMSANSEWNGVFNGMELPPSDYWFLINITDQNNNTSTFRGHFSLVR